MFHGEDAWRTGTQVRDIHATAVIHAQARIGLGVSIGPHVTVYGDVVIESGVTIFAGAVIGRPPMAAGIIPPKHADGPTRIGEGCVIGANAVLYQGVILEGDNLIGDGVTIRENTRVGRQTIIGNNSTVQNDVTFGDRVRVVDLSHVTAGVVVGDDVFWSVGVLSMNDNRDGSGLRAPTVGAGAFIGGGAELLPGVSVGAEAMVAAGSIVTHDVEEGRRVQGVPARPYFRRGADPSYDGMRLRPDDE